MHKFLEIGKIINAHGVKGELKVMSLTDDPNRYKDLKSLYLNDNENLIEYEIEYVRVSGNTVWIKLLGIDSRDKALLYKNHFLLVDRKDAVTLPEDTFFICDIIGCYVYNEGDYLGQVTQVLETGSNDVYVVQTDNKKEILVPALKSVVSEVCLKEKRINVKLPEGLIDDEI